MTLLLRIIIFIILIFEIKSLSMNTDRKNDTKEYKDLKMTHVNYTTFNILKWPNCFWFTLGCGAGIFIMLIVNSPLYCTRWCPNWHVIIILRHIRIVFRNLWHNSVTCFRRHCLHQPEDEYYVTNDRDNLVEHTPSGSQLTSFTTQLAQSTSSISQSTSSVTESAQLTQSPQKRSWSKTISQMKMTTIRDELDSQSAMNQRTSSETQLAQPTSSISQSTSSVTQLAQSTSSISQSTSSVTQLAQPTITTISPTIVQLTTGISTMTTSTSTTTTVPVISDKNPEDYITPLFKY